MKVERGFSGIPKDNLAPSPETDVSLLTPIEGIQGCLTAVMQRADTFFIGHML
ncbi:MULTISPECIES: hypothetical protein [Bacteroides]|uniref:hypothetical protein n=1 Tax=Bacteroides TaxID=816 RepID=UPI001C02AD56|nr:MULTISPECIES: hypothetical protein [Bacteroides]MBT9874175.1 hypothetical protein [Bacteroides salyersiae]